MNEQFCPGLAGREQCNTCEGRMSAEQQATRRVLHSPWPFDPCPHYIKPDAIRAAMKEQGQ